MTIQTLIGRFVVALPLLAAACDVPPVGPDAPNRDAGDAPPFDAPLANFGCEPIGDFLLTVNTLAGCAEFGSTDGTRPNVRFANPVNVTLSASGAELLVADFDNHLIRAVSTTDGTTTTVIGPAQVPPGLQFKVPFGLAQSGDTLYIQTDDNSAGVHSNTTGTLWRWSNGTLSVLAENIGRPRGLVPFDGNKLLLVDHMHHIVSVYDPDAPAEQRITRVAGGYGLPGDVDGAGNDARFNEPYHAVAIGPKVFLLTDFSNHKIRRLDLTTNPTVSTFAGSGQIGDAEGTGVGATFHKPQAIARTDEGTLYVGDLGTGRIRKITPTAVVTNFAGTGTPGFADAAELSAAQFHGLEGMVASTAARRLFIADGGRGDRVPFNRVRSIKLP